jgi:hypothetical protein
VQRNDFEVKIRKPFSRAWSRSRRAAIVMVENRDAITRWRDGLGEMAGRAALALRENWRNTDTFVMPGSCLKPHTGPITMLPWHGPRRRCRRPGVARRS